MENKALELLRRLRPLINNQSGAYAMNAVYISPSQQLRNEADAMDAKERLLREIDDFLAENNK